MCCFMHHGTAEASKHKHEGHVCIHTHTAGSSEGAPAGMQVGSRSGQPDYLTIRRRLPWVCRGIIIQYEGSSQHLAMVYWN